MKESPKYTESSGNVFADLGLPDADELLSKADLAIQISRIIDERALTQAQAAELLGIDQPKVSALVRGRLEGFSIERLTRFLNALGQDVEIVVRPKPRAERQGHTRVISRRRSARAASRVG
ncbi:MAG TPA: helix-turn-helix transcriptional regulator [Longimicrobiaceae bacterium]|jgi:predicted XRE-type DNA-binding protein|nr:helix-turn-helix transcriptional regulator [Longimicrobiaceae bacterium]